LQLEFAVGEGLGPQIELHVAAPLRLPIHLALEKALHAARRPDFARYSAISALAPSISSAVRAVARRQRDGRCWRR